MTATHRLFPQLAQSGIRDDVATTVQFDNPVPRRGVRLKELTGQIFIRLGGPRAIVSSRAASVYRAETAPSRPL
jgi:hypothetical protein